MRTLESASLPTSSLREQMHMLTIPLKPTLAYFRNELSRSWEFYPTISAYRYLSFKTSFKTAAKSFAGRQAGRGVGSVAGRGACHAVTVL